MKWRIGLMTLLFSLVSFVDSQILSSCGPNLGVTLTETTIDSPPYFIEWMGKNNSVVFIRSESLTMYRSGDEGATWQDQTAKFGGNKVFYIIPTANESKIYFVAGMGPTYRIWTTVDEGINLIERTSWEGYANGFVFFYIFPHPKEQDIAIGIGPNRKCFLDSPDCSYDIYSTVNFGSSWQIIDTYVHTLTWGNERETGEVFLLYTTYTTKSGRQSEKTDDSQVLVRVNIKSSPLVSTILYTEVAALFKSEVNDTILFVAEKNANGGMTLLVSENDGESWMTTKFPLSVEENSYTVLDSTEGAVFVNIEHNANSNYGNVYVTDSYGSNFALSLRNNKREASSYPFFGGADFARIEGLDGIYVANVVESGEISVPEVKTVITWDMGGQWRRLLPPRNDSLGNRIRCNSPEECHLNLFGLYEAVYGRFYSVPGSVGLMLGTGNVGRYLTHSRQEVNTYFSRDGGWTWEEFSKGSLVYEIADHGSLIILANNTQKTSKLLYSWNEGLTLEPCIFTSRGDVDVENIVVEPTFTSQKFILYGNRGGLGVLVHVDFTGLHQQACQNPDKAGQPGSDYELWSPSDVGYSDVKKECILGAHTTFTRKKREVRCYNPQSYEPIVASTPCECVREDYACDYCYEIGSNDTCVLVCPDYNPAANCVNYYYASKGYRSVPGDKCVGGLDYNPVKTSCSPIPSPPPSIDNGLPGAAVFAIFLAVVLSLLLAVITGLCLVVRMKKPAIIYDRLKDIKLFRPSSDRARGSDYSKVGAHDEEEESPFIVE